MAATRLTRCLCLRHPIETMLEIYKSPPSRFQKLNWWNIHWAMAKSLFPACLPCWPSQAWWPFQVSIYSTQDFVILQERRIIYIATPIQFPGPQSIWLLRYFIRLSQSGPSLFGCWCLVTLPSFQPMNPGLCYFAREEDYIYCNSCSISGTPIHLVVEIFYTPVTIWAFTFWLLLPGDPPKFPANEPRTLLFCKRGWLYILQLLFNFQDPNPFCCWDILYACHRIWQFCCYSSLLVPSDPLNFPSIQPRTLLFCMRGGLYILQLLFNFQDPNPFGCWDLLYACHNLGLHFLAAGAWWPSQVSSQWTQDFVILQERRIIYIATPVQFQDPNPFGCGGILLPCHQIWQFCCCSLLPGDPLKFPANEPRTLLFCKRGGLYILQLLFNSQDLHPFCCGGIILLCHQIL